MEKITTKDKTNDKGGNTVSMEEYNLGIREGRNNKEKDGIYTSVDTIDMIGDSDTLGFYLSIKSLFERKLLGIPTMDWLADRLNTSKDNCFKYLRKLQDLGLVDIEANNPQLNPVRIKVYDQPKRGEQPCR